MLGQIVATPTSDLITHAYSFGIGWYAPDASPAVYTLPKPLCLDTNFTDLGRSLSSGLWLTHTCTASSLPFSQAQPQPLHDEELLFAQQGFISDFRNTLRPTIRSFLAPEIEADIETNSEVEYLFAVIRHLLADDEEVSIEQALGEMIRLVEEWLQDLPAQINMIISEGEGLYAVRHAINAECSPLYYTTDDESYPNAQLVASEPLTASDFWLPVPENHVLILDPHEPPELLAL